MENHPSEATMRLVRARARVATTYERSTAISTMDAYRWERIASNLASLRFDPALDDARAEDDAHHLDEAERLAANVAAAISRFVRHLEAAGG